MRLLKYAVMLMMLLKMGVSNNINAQVDTLFWFAAPWVTPDHDNNVQLALGFLLLVPHQR